MKQQITYVWCPDARRYVAPKPAAKPAPKKKPAAKRKPAAK